MTKEQINYLLVLATLLVVWLFFNTFYVNAKKNYGGPQFGGMISASDRRSPNPTAMPNIPQPPSIAELLKNQPRGGGQAPIAPRGTPNAPSQAPQGDRAPNS